jgi:hypothetical protein
MSDINIKAPTKKNKKKTFTGSGKVYQTGRGKLEGDFDFSLGNSVRSGLSGSTGKRGGVREVRGEYDIDKNKKIKAYFKKGRSGSPVGSVLFESKF